MVILANKSKKAELIEIWKQSFGDSEEYIQMFFDWNLSKTKVMIYEINGKAVSVAYLLPATYEKVGEKPMPCCYLYAAATLPEFRGCGYFSEIMKVVRDTLTKPVFLVPGEASLVAYYEKQGMKIWQEAKNLEVYPNDKVISTVLKENNYDGCKGIDEILHMRNLSASEYIAKRNSILSKSAHIAWDENFMEYICHENKVCGGYQKAISVNETEYILMYRVEGDLLRVLEILCVKELFNLNEVNICTQLLLKEIDCKKADVCLRPTVMMIDKSHLCEREGYFNLTLG